MTLVARINLDDRAACFSNENTLRVKVVAITIQ